MYKSITESTKNTEIAKTTNSNVENPIPTSKGNVRHKQGEEKESIYKRPKELKPLNIPSLEVKDLMSEPHISSIMTPTHVNRNNR